MTETTAPPCAECGTTGGYKPARCKKPARRSGKKFGADGLFCTGCYEQLKRRAAGKPVRKKLGPLTQDQQRLAADYWSLAAKVAGEFKRANPHSVADFDGAAAIGLFRAAKAWTPDKPYAFATTARLYAKRGCQSDLRDQRIRLSKGRDSPATTISLDGVAHREEFCSHEEPAEAKVEKSEFIDRVLSQLPPKQATLLKLIFCDDLTTEEAGKTLGIKKDMSFYLRRQALEILRSDPRILEVAS